MSKEAIATEQDRAAERALLVCVVLPDSKADPMDPVGELRNLAKAAGADVVDEMVAKRRVVHPGLYVGTGKAQEIADRADQNMADLVIFDNDLSPAQIRDLEAVIGKRVLDRSELILDIFASRARTHEARLQVELAQLEYTYPRLRHMWSHLERVAGGASTAASAVGAIGTRGPGEKQIEIDRRLVQKRVSMLKREIKEIDARKVREVSSRRESFCICLVGYTNAGKSTLMNRLTGAEVYVADQLFATLDTRTRRWNVGEGTEVLLSDTVGFVRDLPHHLVASFRATLEEVIHADLLLHVADASHDRVVEEVEAVEKVLAELKCQDRPRILVFNKIDRMTDPTVRVVLAGKFPSGLFVSAATGENVEALVSAVGRASAGAQVRVSLRADCRNGRLMQYIAQHAKIESQDYEDTTARIEATIPAARIQGLEAFGESVTVTRR